MSILKVEFYDDGTIRVYSNDDRDSVNVTEYFNDVINEVMIDLEYDLENILKEEVRNEYYNLINHDEIKRIVKESRNLEEAVEKIYEYLYETIEEARFRVYYKIKKLLGK